jgi:inosose dehydratase
MSPAIAAKYSPASSMYRPLGQGDVDVPAIVGHVQAHGYSGWYTLEQDTLFIEEPKDEGPLADVRTSAEYLRTVLSQLH